MLTLMDPYIKAVEKMNNETAAVTASSSQRFVTFY